MGSAEKVRICPKIQCAKFVVFQSKMKRYESFVKVTVGIAQREPAKGGIFQVAIFTIWFLKQFLYQFKIKVSYTNPAILDDFL